MPTAAQDLPPDPITTGKLLGTAELVSLSEFAARRAEKFAKTIASLEAGAEAKAAEVAESLSRAGFDPRAQADGGAVRFGLWDANCRGGKTLKLWPFSKRETRSQGAYTASYVQSARMAAMGTETALSATVATCAGVWTRAFGMLSAEGGAADALNPAVLSAIGADLFWRGESCWHIAFDGSDLELRRAAHWDEQAGGRFLLSLPSPDGTDSVKALAPEVLRLVINPDPSMPWRGRSPLSFLGLSAKLMADLEGAVVNALPYAGKGILPLPANLGEQSGAVTAGLRSGGLAVITSKADLAHHTGGRAEEWRRVELTPDLSKMELNGLASDLHARILGACGVPPGLLQQGAGAASGLRETYRVFALATVAPLSASITPELNRKLSVTKLSLDSLMSADVAGRARAVSSLVQSGLGLAEAMALVGWSGVTVPDGSKASPGAVKEAVEE